MCDKKAAIIIPKKAFAKVKAFLFTFENATNLLHYTDMGAIS